MSVAKDLLDHAWDTHVHVLEPARFASSKERTYTPAMATADELLMKTSAKNFLIVQASVEDGWAGVLAHVGDLAHKHPDRQFRAEILYEDAADTGLWTDKRLRILHEAGVRCLRVRNPTTSDDAIATAKLEILLRARLRPVAKKTGWALSMQLPLRIWASLSGILEREMAGVTIIAEHCGSITVPMSASDDKAFGVLEDLVRKRVVSVKLGALHRRIREGGSMAQLLEYIRRLAEAGPDQLLWGSDWPHVDSTPRGTVESPHLVVNVEAEVDALASCMSVPTLTSMLIDTPARLFG